MLSTARGYATTRAGRNVEISPAGPIALVLAPLGQASLTLGYRGLADSKTLHGIVMLLEKNQIRKICGVCNHASVSQSVSHRAGLLN